jgi:hypothetical protein
MARQRRPQSGTAGVRRGWAQAAGRVWTSWSVRRTLEYPRRPRGDARRSIRPPRIRYRNRPLALRTARSSLRSMSGRIGPPAGYEIVRGSQTRELDARLPPRSSLFRLPHIGGNDVHVSMADLDAAAYLALRASMVGAVSRLKVRLNPAARTAHGRDRQTPRRFR